MFNPLTLRRISMVVLVTFTSLTMQPLQAAIQMQDKMEQGKANSPLTQRQQPNQYHPQNQANKDALSRTLVDRKRGHPLAAPCQASKQIQGGASRQF